VILAVPGSEVEIDPSDQEEGAIAAVIRACGRPGDAATDLGTGSVSL
jgi:hypothetical protein